MLQNLMERMHTSIQRFLYGRNGVDQLTMALLFPYLLSYLLLTWLGGWPFQLLTWAVMGLILFRTLSRNLERRRGENAAFLKWFAPLRSRFIAGCNRVQDREHRYFRCPGCGQQMRVPRGKGRIHVHCRSCGTTFETKS